VHFSWSQTVLRVHQKQLNLTDLRIMHFIKVLHPRSCIWSNNFVDFVLYLQTTGNWLKLAQNNSSQPLYCVPWQIFTSFTFFSMQGRGTNFYRKSYIESNLKEKILKKKNDWMANVFTRYSTRFSDSNKLKNIFLRDNLYSDRKNRLKLSRNITKS